MRWANFRTSGLTARWTPIRPRLTSARPAADTSRAKSVSLRFFFSAALLLWSSAGAADTATRQNAVIASRARTLRTRLIGVYLSSLRISTVRAARCRPHPRGDGGGGGTGRQALGARTGLHG